MIFNVETLKYYFYYIYPSAPKIKKLKYTSQYNGLCENNLYILKQKQAS